MAGLIGAEAARVYADGVGIDNDIAASSVRDNIHSFDLVNAFWYFFEVPWAGEVYNIGGGRDCNCSMLELLDA